MEHKLTLAVEETVGFGFVPLSLFFFSIVCVYLKEVVWYVGFNRQEWVEAAYVGVLDLLVFNCTRPVVWGNMCPPSSSFVGWLVWRGLSGLLGDLLVSLSSFSFFFTSASVSHTIACWCARARAWRLCIFGTWVVYVYDVGSLFGAVMCRNREETSNGNVMANVSHWHDLEKRKSRHYIW